MHQTAATLVERLHLAWRNAIDVPSRALPKADVRRRPFPSLEE